MARETPISYRPTPAAAEALSERTDKTGRLSRSGALSRSIERYAEMVRRSTPKLSNDEWGLLCDALDLIEPAPMVAVLAHGVADAVKLDGLDQKWGVDGEALVATLLELSYAELCAVADTAERYQIEGESLIDRIAVEDD